MIIKNWKLDIGDYSGLDCFAPCDMYSVLLSHGLIDDPYYGTNEKEVLDFSKKDCVFYTDFNLTENDLGREKIELCFYGLDTICDIYFNGALLDSVMNMHRLYKYDVKAPAKKATTKKATTKKATLTTTVTFTSPL